MFDRYTFHQHSFCVWQEVPIAGVKDSVVNFTSDSGSHYILTDEGVFRISNHWGRVGNCYWRLLPLAQYQNQKDTVGYAKWVDFCEYNETKPLFYISVDWESGEVQFQHQSTWDSCEKIALRNAAETAKTIRIIKEVLTESHWAKHLKYVNMEDLRREIVSELICTTKSFIEIKKSFLF